MPSRLLASLAVYVSLILTSQTSAADVISFSTTVSGASGVHAGEFTPGSTATISYELDETTIDSNPSVSSGLFFGATESLTFDFSDLGLFVSFSDGTVQTFDNTATPDDQWFVQGLLSQNAATLGGELITFVELGFTGTTSMLTSDTIPDTLPTDVTFLSGTFGTASGFTQINFSPNISSVPGPGTLVLFIAGLFGLVRRSRIK